MARCIQSLTIIREELVPMQQPDILNSWKEISSYIGRGVRTVQRWEKDFGLPVRRPSGHLRGSVLALKPDIDTWLNGREAREARMADLSSAINRPAPARQTPEEQAHYLKLRKNAESLMEK